MYMIHSFIPPQVSIRTILLILKIKIREPDLCLSGLTVELNKVFFEGAPPGKWDILEILKNGETDILKNRKIDRA